MSESYLREVKISLTADFLLNEHEVDEDMHRIWND